MGVWGGRGGVGLQLEGGGEGGGGSICHTGGPLGDGHIPGVFWRERERQTG